MSRQDLRLWILVGVGVLIVASILLSSGFRNTIDRRRAIGQLKSEIASVSDEIQKVRAKMKELKTNPHAYEVLIRQELGYLKPGEKEVRFSDIHQ